MRFRLGVTLVAALLGACTHLPTGGSAGTQQILVTIHQQSAPARGLTGDPGHRYLRRRGYGPAPPVDRALNRLAREHGMRRVQGWTIGSINVYCAVFEIPPERDLDALLAALTSDSRVDLAEPIQAFETLGSGYNDPLADLQTSVARLGIEAVHGLTTGRGVTVAVIDSRIDARHPELRGRVPLVRDLVGDRRGGRAAGEIHGTAVAGVIASAANNSEGIVGIAPDAELAALRACWSTSAGGHQASCSNFTLAQALEVALQLEPDVINLSLAGPQDRLLARLLDAAIARGIIVVAALADRAGDRFPASHRGVIAVRSDGSQARVAHGYLLSAPGTEVLSTTPEGGYAFFSGASLAAAQTSGVIALLRERDPQLTADGIVALLNETSARQGSSHSISACHAVARLTANTGLCFATEAMAREAR